MALNKIQIISQALSLLGIPGTNQIDPNNSSQVFAEQAFDFLYPSTLAKEDWRFTTVLQQLSKSITPPIIDEWSNAFVLPAGMLALVRVIPRGNFQIYGDRLYSNSNELKLEFRKEIDIAKAPDYFTEYMIYILAEYLSLAIAEKISYQQVMEKKKNIAMGKAAFLDAQSHSNIAMQSNAFLDVRGGNNRFRGR